MVLKRTAKQITISFGVLASVLAASCTKSENESTPTATTETSTLQGKSFVATGQLAVGSFGLTATNPITHVIAFNAESGRSKIAEVSAEGKFELPLTSKLAKVEDYTKADGTIDREKLEADGFATVEELAQYTDAQIKEGLTSELEEQTARGDQPSPWIVTYVNKNKTGADMIVSRFGSETLDTLAPSSDSTKTLDSGTITPVDGARATSTATYAGVLEATGISEAAAATLGEVDTVSLRNSNPDINNNGVFDATENKTFLLDFHNRFIFTAVGDTGMINKTSQKNKFPDEVVGGATNLAVSYTGTGIVPELEKSEFTAAPSTYAWKFNLTGSTTAVDLNHSDTCAEGGTTIANGATCTLSYTVDPNYDRYQLGIEVKTPPEGTYTLTAGGQTFTWTNVEVSDFSAGNGFLALMVSYTVDEKGTTDAADDVMTGFKYKFMKKDATAGWVAATQEEISLIVKPNAARIGLKFSDSTMQCGWRIAMAPSGEVVFGSSDVDEACDQNADSARIAEIKAGTFLWSKFSDSGVSYDDKLGMRFFF